MTRSTFNDLSLNEMFAMINRLQAENTKQKSELLAAQQKIATYESAMGNEEEVQLLKQDAILQGAAQPLTFEELTAGAPIDDDFAPNADDAIAF